MKLVEQDGGVEETWQVNAVWLEASEWARVHINGQMFSMMVDTGLRSASSVPAPRSLVWSQGKLVTKPPPLYVMIESISWSFSERFSRGFMLYVMYKSVVRPEKSNSRPLISHH